MLIKLVADGKLRIYFADPWNKFDFSVVMLGYIDFLPIDLGEDSSALMGIRLLR